MTGISEQHVQLLSTQVLQDGIPTKGWFDMFEGCLTLLCPLELCVLPEKFVAGLVTSVNSGTTSYRSLSVPENVEVLPHSLVLLCVVWLTLFG